MSIQSSELIFEAVYRHRFGFLESVVTTENVDLFSCDEDEGKTLLMASTELNDPYLLHLLLMRGANPYLRTGLRRDNALLWCCKYGTGKALCAIVKQMLKDGMLDVDMPNGEGDTAVLLAAAHGRRDILTVLLKYRPDLHRRNKRSENVFDLLLRMDSPGSNAAMSLLASHAAGILLERARRGVWGGCREPEKSA